MSALIIELRLARSKVLKYGVPRELHYSGSASGEFIVRNPVSEGASENYRLRTRRLGFHARRCSFCPVIGDTEWKRDALHNIERPLPCKLGDAEERYQHG